MAPLMPCRRRDLLRFVTGRSGCFQRLTEPDLVLHNGVCTPWTPRNRRLRRWPSREHASWPLLPIRTFSVWPQFEPAKWTWAVKPSCLAASTPLPSGLLRSCAICARWIVICGRLRPLSRPSGSGRRPPGEWVVGFKYDDTKTADSGLYNKRVKLHGSKDVRFLDRRS